MARKQQRINRAKSNGQANMPRLAAAAGVSRTLDAHPDTPDFRDKVYDATLIEVPPVRTLADYLKAKPPILDQGQEGACTGFGLAAVANYLLRTRRTQPDRTIVSARMLYEMARRYDEWPGEDYSGSSARGAMKGWHKHGVCSAKKWPYDVAKRDGSLDAPRATDATNRPLGAYYRVNHKDLVCMHSAITEVGILYATAQVHAGWQSPRKDGYIKREPEIIGGHAFAIVAYDRDGIWIQNSWGVDWGRKGFAHISYDDWLANGSDVWVARLGAPVGLDSAEAVARGNSVVAGLASAYTSADLRPHIVSLKNDGQLQPNGTYGKAAEEVKAIFTDDFKSITKNWARKRILLYAHGGLVDEASAVQHVADCRSMLLDSQIYPLAFIWHSDFWSTLGNILADAVSRRRPEGFLDKGKDFMLDRFDDALEPLARGIGGKAQWDEMKENATLATRSETGGARLVAQCVADLVRHDPSIEIHMIGHSAGAVFHAPLLQLLTGDPNTPTSGGPMDGRVGLGLKVSTCSLWAPACTTQLFKEAYVPAIEDAAKLGRFALFSLTDRAEQDDHCARIYNKSLLYLVSNSFEDKGRIPLFRHGWPILGMERFIRTDAKIASLFPQKADWILAPNAQPVGAVDASRSTSHGGFDNDEATLRATVARIAGTVAASKTAVIKHKSSSLLRTQRLGIDVQTDVMTQSSGRAASRRTVGTP